MTNTVYAYSTNLEKHHPSHDGNWLQYLGGGKIPDLLGQRDLSLAGDAVHELLQLHGDRVVGSAEPAQRLLRLVH